jgi:hypothetical protein
MCRRPQTSVYSYLRVTTIQIDVHPAGKNWPTRHMHPCSVCVWSLTIRISHGQRIVIFHVAINRVEQGHCSREKGLPTQSTARWLTDPRSVPNFSPKATIEAVGTKPTFCWESATRLTGPITPACDQYIQYLLTGPNSSVLNWYRRGYNLGGVSFPHHTLRPSQVMVLRFPPKGPIRSQIIQHQHKSLVNVMRSTYHQPVVFWSLDIYRSLYLCLAMANVIQILARSSRVTQKVFIMQLQFQPIPINLMHNHS